jgi:hypothetical protein
VDEPEIVRENPGFVKIPDDIKSEGIKMETVQINMGDVKITFYGQDGEPLKPGELARLHRWKIEGAGIDTNRVVSVQIPKLDYMDGGLVTLTVRAY